jgi:hypothetical protein
VLLSLQRLHITYVGGSTMDYQVLILDAMNVADWTLPDDAAGRAAVIQARAMAGAIWD